MGEMKLEDLGASKLIKYVDEKQQRRNDREAGRKFRAKVQTEPETVFMNFADSNSNNVFHPTDSDDLIDCTGGERSQPTQNQSHRLPSPFEFQQSYSRSSFLSRVNVEVTRRDDSEETDANKGTFGAEVSDCVDDGDFWLDDDS